MRTLAQIEASRRTGAESRGAATPERETPLAHRIPLTPEEQEDYRELHGSYIAHYAPTSPLEALLVRKCVSAEFLLTRAQNIQHTLIDLQAAASQADLDEAFPGLATADVRAAGFQTLNDQSTSFRNMDAHQSRLLRELSHYLERLEKLRRNRPEKEPHKANEPETSPEPEVSL